MEKKEKKNFLKIQSKAHTLALHMRISRFRQRAKYSPPVPPSSQKVCTPAKLQDMGSVSASGCYFSGASRGRGKQKKRKKNSEAEGAESSKRKGATKQNKSSLKQNKTKKSSQVLSKTAFGNRHGEPVHQQLLRGRFS
jgi:hypothetical protein